MSCQSLESKGQVEQSFHQVSFQRNSQRLRCAVMLRALVFDNVTPVKKSCVIATVGRTNDVKPLER